MLTFLLLLTGTCATNHLSRSALRQGHSQKPADKDAEEVEWPWMHEATSNAVLQEPVKDSPSAAESTKTNPMFHSVSTKETSQMRQLAAPSKHHGIKLPLIDDVTLDPRPPSLHEEVDSAIDAQLRNRVSKMLAAQGTTATTVPSIPWWVLLIVCIGFVLLICMMLTSFGAAMLGRSIKSAIETFDQKFLGVDIEIGDLSVAICSGRVDMQGFQVKNPEGYKSPYLLNASTVVIDLNVVALVTSLGKRIEVDVLQLDDIDCIVEYDKAFGGTSNVDRVMEHLNHDAKPSEKKAKQVESVVNETGKAPPKKAPSKEIVMHNVLFSDIGARVATKLGGVRVAIGDIKFDDFSKENGPGLLEDIVFIIMKSFTKTLLVNITGKSFADRFL